MDGQRHCKGIYNCTFNLIDSCEFYTYHLAVCDSNLRCERTSNNAVCEPQINAVCEPQTTLCATLKQRCVRPSNNAVCDPQTTLCATLKQRCVRPSNNAVCDLHLRCVRSTSSLCATPDTSLY